MNKISLILKYFQKKDCLCADNKDYQNTIASLFNWLVTNDKVTSDKTSKYFPNISSQSKIIAKDVGILSGIEEIEFLLKKFTSLSFKLFIHDGAQFENGDVIAQIKGNSHKILAYERTILNILQRMSSIASETNQLISLINPSHHTASITNTSDRLHLLSTATTLPYLAATRKTPWMSLDKKAVAVGGGLTHRLNLSDGILIKDNHLAMIKRQYRFKTDEEVIMKALEMFNSPAPPLKLIGGQGGVIEIEVTNYYQANQAIKTFQSRKDTWIDTNFHLAILLDNFSPRNAQQTISNLKKDFDLSSIIFEASGGIDENNILEWAKTGVDIVSLGSLTHSSKAINFSLELN